MSNLDVLQAQVGEWSKTTFPQSTRWSILEHLKEEVEELEYSQSNRTDAEECADCLLLLLHLSHRIGFSLFDATEKKFADVQKRIWDDGANRGYSKHVEESSK